MSYCEKDGSYAMDGHTQVMRNPYAWMAQNQDKVVELNARHGEQFEKVMVDRLTKYQKELDDREKQAAANLLSQSKIINNLHIETNEDLLNEPYEPVQPEILESVDHMPILLNQSETGYNTAVDDINASALDSAEPIEPELLP